MTELKFKEGGDLENGRMYDPVIGRFLGVDPIIADGDNSQSFNSYTYALNNPLGLIDRDGFQYEEAYTGGPVVASISTCSFDTWREMRRQAKEYDKLTYLDCVGIATGYQDELAVLIQRQEQQKYGPKGDSKGNDANFVADMTGKICSSVLEFFMGLFLVPEAAFAKTFVCSGTRGFKFINSAKGGVQAEYTFTKTAAKHLTEVVKRGGNAGQLARPYMKSPLTIQEIMSAGKGIPDATFHGGMNWLAPGTFRGSQGIWQLGINPETNVIYHFNFVY